MMSTSYHALVLASASQSRAGLMRNAGLEFDAVPAEIDERAVEKPLLDAQVEIAGIAEILAQAKAMEVSARRPGAHVVGADQVLGLDEKILHKPRSMDEARRRLLQLSGRVHQLHSAVCIVRDGETMWSLVDTCHIRFRKLDPGFVGRHLALVGEAALSSVGAYQIEGPGIQLIDSYEGDYFSVLGLPLMPLLAKLREYGVVDA